MLDVRQRFSTKRRQPPVPETIQLCISDCEQGEYGAPLHGRPPKKATHGLSVRQLTFARMKEKSTLILGGLILLGLILGCANPFGRSLYKCKSDLIADPKTAQDYASIGIHHLNRDEIDCGFGACSEAVRLDPKYAPGYACRGHLSTDEAAALRDFEKAIRLDPNFADTYFYRSNLYDRRGETDRALEDASTGLKLYRQSGSSELYLVLVLNKRARLYEQKGDYEHALADYSEAIRIDAKDAWSYLGRAEIYRKLGRNDLADLDQRKADELKSPGEKAGEPSPPKEDPNSKNGGVVSLGIINDQAIDLVRPPYPPIARAARASGEVLVTVVVNESGEVVEASARSGHPLLQGASVAAARRVRFRPLVKNGKRTKFTGHLRYTFTAPN